jgi:hypothetical protein
VKSRKSLVLLPQAGSIGLDESGKLYWNGKELVTKQKITLQWWANISILIGAISTLILAIVAIAEYVK